MAGKKEQVLAAGAKTRFKPGHKHGTKHQGNQYSGREQLRWVLEQDFDLENMEESFKKLGGPIKKGQRIVKGARAFAIKYFARALSRGDPHLFDKILDQTEGKLSQEIILPNKERPNIDHMSDEEVHAAYLARAGK